MTFGGDYKKFLEEEKTGAETKMQQAIQKYVEENQQLKEQVESFEAQFEETVNGNGNPMF